MGNPTASSPLRVTVINPTTNVRSHYSLTGRSGNTVTGTPADGYEDIAFPANSIIHSRIVAADMNDIQSAINTLETDGSLAIGQPVSGAADNGLLVVTNGDLSNSVSLTWDDSTGSFRVNEAGVITKLQSNGLGILGTESNHDLGLYTTNTQRVLVTSNGLVGINATSPGAQLQINTRSSSTKGLIVRGSTSQTANLTEWQDGTGAFFAGLTPTGNLTFNPLATTVPSNKGIIFPNAHAIYDNGSVAIGIYNPAANANRTTLQVLRSTDTSPTSDIQKWTTAAGSVLASVSAAGNFVTTGNVIPAGIVVGATTPRSPLDVRGTVTLGTPGSLHGVITSNDGLYINTDVNATGTNDGRIVIGTGRAYDSGGTVWAYFDRLGKIGIANGTTTPGAQVQINTSAANLKALIVKGAASQSANLLETQNSSGTSLVTVKPGGEIGLASMADSAASNSSLYFSTTSSKPSWKDSSGVVSALI